jgi:hypothetical protein
LPVEQLEPQFFTEWATNPFVPVFFPQLFVDRSHCTCSKSNARQLSELQSRFPKEQVLPNSLEHTVLGCTHCTPLAQQDWPFWPHAWQIFADEHVRLPPHALPGQHCTASDPQLSQVFVELEQRSAGELQALFAQQGWDWFPQEVQTPYCSPGMVLHMPFLHADELSFKEQKPHAAGFNLQSTQAGLSRFVESQKKPFGQTGHFEGVLHSDEGVQLPEFGPLLQQTSPPTHFSLEGPHSCGGVQTP